MFPDERTPDPFQARVGRRSLRGPHVVDFIDKTKTEKWKALVEILGLDAIESREKTCSVRETTCAEAARADEELANLLVVPWRRAPR